MYGSGSRSKSKFGSGSSKEKGLQGITVSHKWSELLCVECGGEGVPDSPVHGVCKGGECPTVLCVECVGGREGPDSSVACKGSRLPVKRGG